MDFPPSRRLNVWTPLLFALVLILGMTLGFRLRDTLRNKRDIQAVIERNDRLEEIIDLVKERYVDTLNTNALYKDAVTGILSHLDPHTAYIPAEDLGEVNESLEGSFFGIGVEFDIVKDTIQVTSVIEGGPAERAGVTVGDKLVKVGDSTVAGTGITSERIIAMLRGKQNSRVNVTLRDALTGKLKPATITRDVVPIYSVDASVMLDSATGFIKINRFAANTYDEFIKALKNLQAQGMKQLVLDLRQNPGGYLDVAAEIADEFLDGDKMIVYTQGRQSEKTEYKAKRQGLFESGKLSVLIDEGSASASEILAGAVQDWDRGVVLGRRSFGKGLVQEQYDLEDGSALRLTVAKYYTPSGRSIQRSYKKGKAAYDEDYAKRFENGELTGLDTLTHDDTVKYYTSSRRVVFGGGGIKPDVYVPYDTSRLNNQLLDLVFGNQLQAAVWSYYTLHAAELKQYKSVGVFSRDFNTEAILLPAYLNSLQPDAKKAAIQLLARADNKAYFLSQAKAQLARILYRNNGYYYITAQGDNMVRRALQTFRTPQYSQLIKR